MLYRPCLRASNDVSSPDDVIWALVEAMLLPAPRGAILGIPVGIELYGTAGRHSSTIPSRAALPGMLTLTLLVVGALTTIPARIGVRRPVAELPQSETG
jgi:hypothetical protein